MTQSHDEFLWRRAAELLQIERLLEGEPQEVSGNYDRVTRSCPLFADFGAGDMRALGVACPHHKWRRASGCWQRVPVRPSSATLRSST
jgi:hypothetical protein